MYSRTNLVAAFVEANLPRGNQPLFCLGYPNSKLPQTKKINGTPCLALSPYPASREFWRPKPSTFSWQSCRFGGRGRPSLDMAEMDGFQAFDFGAFGLSLVSTPKKPGEWLEGNAEKTMRKRRVKWLKALWLGIPQGCKVPVPITCDLHGIQLDWASARKFQPKLKVN